jgi:hypothetical protein
LSADAASRFQLASKLLFLPISDCCYALLLSDVGNTVTGLINQNSITGCGMEDFSAQIAMWII